VEDDARLALFRLSNDSFLEDDGQRVGCRVVLDLHASLQYLTTRLVLRSIASKRAGGSSSARTPATTPCARSRSTPSSCASGAGGCPGARRRPRSRHRRDLPHCDDRPIVPTDDVRVPVAQHEESPPTI